MLDFNQKTALITGAARGIGEGIARNLAEKGCKVILVDLNEEVQSISTELNDKGQKATYFVGDITNKKFVESIIEDTQNNLGAIDILINNAGITKDNFLSNISEADWDNVIDVNLKGAFLMSQAVFGLMKKNNYGKIINIISASWLGNIGQANYSASKGGLVGLTRTLALELARFNINVNGVSPGLIDTPMSQKIPDKVKQKLIESRPLKRMGTIDDIANSVAFLASDLSQYITGQILHVDGGKSCGALAL